MGIDWNEYDVEQFRMGLDVELEHGTVSPDTFFTNDNLMLTAKIALPHLNEFLDYYTQLDVLEEEATAVLKKRKKDRRLIYGT